MTRFRDRTSPRGEVVLLTEIEEGAISPKKLLGDLLAILMCNGFSVRTGVGREYSQIAPDTRFSVAGDVSPRGSKLRKIPEVVTPRLAELGGLSDAVDPRNVSLLLESDIQTTIGVLKDPMREVFHEG